MRRLLPDPADPVAVYDAYRPVDPHAPLVRLNMVMAADGAVVDRAGRAGGLGGPADRAVFRSLRALADAVLVGAGTIRVEGYGPHRLPPELAARRRRDGRATPAAIVVVSRSLDLDYRSRLFTQAATPTVVLTCAAAPAERRARAQAAARVLVAGRERVDLAAGLRLLRDELGLAAIVCEGGPRLNTALLRAGCVDELCLTLAPSLAGGRLRGLARDLDAAVELELLSVCEQDAELFLRYRVAAPGGGRGG